MGCVLLFQLTQPNANLWTKTTVNFGIPYWSISTSLNIIVTLLIVGRLMFIRQRTRAVLSTNHSRTYTSIAAMLVESAALYSITALLFIITYARNSNLQNLLLPVLGQVQAISPLLIMWRVARGQAISRETINSVPISNITWKHSLSSSRPGVRSTTTMGDSSTTNLNRRISMVSAGQGLSLPPVYPGSPSQTYMSSTTAKSVLGDADSDIGWELAERGEVKPRGLQVLVERQVERTEDK